MKELIVLSVIYIIFLFASVFFRKRAIIVKKKWLFVYIIVYVIAISLYFELAVKLHQTLRNNKIYLEFGHADILLLELFVICYITATGFIISIFYRRKTKHSS